jgi:hypothetical protein
MYTIILEQRHCNDDSNYMVLGYIPNHGFGKGRAKKKTADMKIQDEHNCLSLSTNQIIKFMKQEVFGLK